MADFPPQKPRIIRGLELERNEQSSRIIEIQCEVFLQGKSTHFVKFSRWT